MASDEQNSATNEDNLPPGDYGMNEGGEDAYAEGHEPAGTPQAQFDDWERLSPAAEPQAYEERGGDEESPTGDAVDSSTNVYDSPDSMLFNVTDGRGGTFTRELFQSFISIQPKEQAQRDEDEEPLIERTTVLPARPLKLAEFAPQELSVHLEKLKEQRLILISCPDEDLMLDAAYALVEKLEIPWGEQRRLLNFQRLAKEGVMPSLFFLRKRNDGVAETAIVVNAVGESSRQFLDSLISANRLSLVDIQYDLRRNGIYLLCLIDSDYVEDRFKAEQRPSKELTIAHWRISFLRPLLRQHFPERADELEEKILEQRRRNWWSGNDREFYYELKGEIETGRLPEVIDSRQGVPPALTPPQTIFKGDDPLHNTILYVATFLPNLSPREFRKVTHMLLEAQAKSMPPAPPRPLAPQGIDDGAVSREKDFMRRWVETPDDLLRECRLITTPLNSSLKVIGFETFRLREELHEYLEREYSLFLEQQFERLQQLGMLFNSSARIAEGVMRLAIEMASAYPEDYGARSLAETVNSFKQVINSAEDATADSGSGLFQALGVTDASQGKRLLFQRASELLRRMLEVDGMEGAVDAFMQQLILSRNFKLVFEIVKRLQLAPNFDEFKWLKQLVERGDPETRQQVYGYLFGYLKKVRSRVYQILLTLEPWLPEPTRPAQSYSESNRYALRLLLAYCLRTSLKFDKKLFGCWPSQYPLFSFRDAETARRNLRLLTKWLFHPGMSLILREHKISWYSVQFLTVNWIFILLDRDEADPPDADCGTVPMKAGTTDVHVSAVEVRDILLAQIVLNADRAQQNSLLAYWEKSGNFILDEITNAPYGSAEQKRLARRREILADTVTRFRALQYELGVETS